MQCFGHSLNSSPQTWSSCSQERERDSGGFRPGFSSVTPQLIFPPQLCNEFLSHACSISKRAVFLGFQVWGAWLWLCCHPLLTQLTCILLKLLPEHMAGKTRKNQKEQAQRLCCGWPTRLYLHIFACCFLMLLYCLPLIKLQECCQKKTE